MSSDCGTGRDPDEIRHEFMPLLAGDALRMELDAVDRQAAMAKSLKRSVLALGVDGEAIGPFLPGHGQRVIAGRRERRGEAAEQAAAVVADGAGLAVHRPLR